MFFHLFYNYIHNKITIIYTNDNSFWVGEILHVWVDSVTIKTERCPKVTIPYARIDSIRDYDCATRRRSHWAVRTNIENSYNKVSE